MQRLSGVLLILAGAALGAYSYLPAPQNGAEKLAEVTRISAAPDRVITSSISPSVTTPAIAEPARNGDGTRVFSNATPLAPIASEASSAETARAPASAWSTVVTTEPAAQMQKLTSPKPGDAQTRTVLTSDLQRELKRVGCYAGEINGAWTPSTQRAMSAFMERVNATLPTAEPDYILLTLVQGHTATACGAECPSGEVMTAGRCVPQAVVAQATRKSQRAEERRVAELHKVQQQELLAQEQRTAEAQKIAEKSKLANAAVAERSETARKVADAPLDCVANHSQ